MFSNKEWYGVFSFITMSNILVCGCPSGGILALDPTSMITLHRESAHSESVSAVVKINELTFASTSKKGVIKLWRIKSN